MLFEVSNGQRITNKPHYDDYLAFRKRLTDEDYQAIEDELNSRIDGKEVHTSSWIPGNNWDGTVFAPIFHVACGGDYELSGMCFGLFLWYIMQERHDEWYVMNSEDVRGKIYFRKNS